MRGDRSDELKGMEDETVRVGSARGASAPNLTLRLAPHAQAMKMREKLDQLTLSNDAIWEREYSRPQIKCVAVSSTAAARLLTHIPRAAGRRGSSRPPTSCCATC